MIPVPHPFSHNFLPTFHLRHISNWDGLDIEIYIHWYFSEVHGTEVKIVAIIVFIVDEKKVVSYWLKVGRSGTSSLNHLSMISMQIFQRFHWKLLEVSMGNLIQACYQISSFQFWIVRVGACSWFKDKASFRCWSSQRLQCRSLSLCNPVALYSATYSWHLIWTCVSFSSSASCCEV